MYQYQINAPMDEHWLTSIFFLKILQKGIHVVSYLISMSIFKLI